jgi:hypothetical protein
MSSKAVVNFLFKLYINNNSSSDNNSISTKRLSDVSDNNEGQLYLNNQGNWIEPIRSFGIGNTKGGTDSLKSITTGMNNTAFGINSL